MADEKKSVAKVVYPPELSGSNTTLYLDQGVYVTTTEELYNPSSPKIRPNNDFYKIKNGIPVNITEGPFDDLEGEVSFTFNNDYTFVDATTIEDNILTGFTKVLDGDGGIDDSVSTVFKIRGPDEGLIPATDGWSYVKRFNDSGKDVKLTIAYDWTNTDPGISINDYDWPFYVVSTTEPLGDLGTGSPGVNFGSPGGNILDPTTDATQTGNVEFTWPQNEWLAFGVYSTDSSDGIGFLTGTISAVSVTPVLVFTSSNSRVILDYTHNQGNTRADDKVSGYNIVPSHEHLDYDFGQLDLFQDGAPYEEVDSFNNITGSLTIIRSNDPGSIVLPFSIVNISDEENIDGTIEPQDIRKYIDRTTEVPFHVRGTWGYIGTPDSYRRSVVIEQQYETISSRLRLGGEIGSNEPFLDGQQNIGSGSNALDSEALDYIYPATSIIEPFVDTTDGVATSIQVSGSVDFLDVIISRMVSGSNLPGSDYLRKDHVSLSRGFDYDNSEFGFDSVAFGGLLK